MKRSVRCRIAAVSAVLCLASGVLCASRVYEYSFKNTYNTGSVCIELDQYQKDDNGKLTPALPGVIMPGDKTDYIPIVTNNRADCYVRVRITITSDDANDYPITTANVFGVNSEWKQIGDDFYYTRILRSGESSEVFQGITIPALAEQGSGGLSGFRIDAVADAIQSKNFVPDFNSELPWGPVFVEHEKSPDPFNYCRTALKATAEKKLVFRGNGGFEADTDDLFKDYEYIMAGDTCSDSLNIVNSSGNRIKVYFRTMNIGSKLNDRTGLDLRADGLSVYSGSLTSERLNEHWCEVTELNAWENSELEFDITLPDASMNEYSILNDDVIWQFRVVEDEAVKTGDEKQLILWLFCMSISFILCIASILIVEEINEGRK